MSELLTASARMVDAMNLLASVARDDTFGMLQAAHPDDLAAKLAVAFDEVAAFARWDTWRNQADWRERRTRLEGLCGRGRDLLATGGVNDEVRNLAREVVETFEPAAARLLSGPPGTHE
ncbi:MAG TPA: hypothetical protein VFL83_00700 [Anaeromyxobacter sp.]|nr:hypothetical protein [Anaeromyxobacter sp.]